MRIRLVLASMFAIFSIASQGSGISGEHIETQIDGDRERVETGAWIQDDAGRSIFDIDDGTQMHVPFKGVELCTNSKRGKYSERRIRLTSPPMGSPDRHIRVTECL